MTGCIRFVALHGERALRAELSSLADEDVDLFLESSDEDDDEGSEDEEGTLFPDPPGGPPPLPVASGSERQQVAAATRMHFGNQPEKGAEAMIRSGPLLLLAALARESTEELENLPVLIQAHTNNRHAHFQHL